MRRQDDLLNSAPVAILIYWACGVWPMGRTGYGIERVRGGHALGSSVLPTDVEISRLSKPRASPGRQPAARLARMRVPPSRLWVDGRSRQPARSPPPQRPPPAAPQPARSTKQALVAATCQRDQWPPALRRPAASAKCCAILALIVALLTAGVLGAGSYFGLPIAMEVRALRKNRGACCRFSKGFRHRKYD